MKSRHPDHHFERLSKVVLSSSRILAREHMTMINSEATITTSTLVTRKIMLAALPIR